MSFQHFPWYRNYFSVVAINIRNNLKRTSNHRERRTKAKTDSNSNDCIFQKLKYVYVYWKVEVGCIKKYCLCSNWWERVERSLAFKKHTAYFLLKNKILKRFRDNNSNVCACDNFLMEKVRQSVLCTIPAQSRVEETYWGPLRVVQQVSFGCWITWSISSWQNPYNRVLFGQAEFWW